LLSMIREVVTASGGALNFLSFDKQRQALVEIDQDYQRLKGANPQEAARIRDAQLAAMISGMDYRRLREIDSTLLDEYLSPALHESASLSPYLDTLLAPGANSIPQREAPAGVSDFFGDEEEEVLAPGTTDSDVTVVHKPSLSGLYTMLAQATADEDLTLTGRDGETATLSRTAVATELFSGLTVAIENKKRDSRRIDDLVAPILHLREAASALDKVASAYTDVQGRPNFNRSQFESTLQAYRRAEAAFTAAVTPREEPGV
jgi:hypothetical protein